MLATNLDAALNNFGPEPLVFSGGMDRSDFYVERHDDPLRHLRIQLRQGRSHAKYLLSGHRGSGKSTELNRFIERPEIAAKHVVVKFSAKETLDLNDLSFIDLLFAAVAKTYEVLTTEPIGIKLDVASMASLTTWVRLVSSEVVTDAVSTNALEGDVGVKSPPFFGFFTKLLARTKLEAITRRTTREAVEPRLSEFVEGLSRFFRDVNDHLDVQQRRLLLVIEDLDKIPTVDKARALFHDSASYLSQPPCSIIYTLPIALHYSADFATGVGSIGESVFLPNVRLREPRMQGAAYEPGREVMREFVRKRMDVGLVDRAALDVAVTMSGGTFYQMQRLMQAAIINALAANLTQVTTEAVLEAASDLRAQFERPLTKADRAILLEVHERQEASGDAATLNLLHGLQIVEYRNGDRWCDVNPLLWRSLERWQPATPPDT